MTGTHPFDNAVHLDVIDADVRRGNTHPEWANMVGPFGGITAAIMVRAIETHPDRIGEPLALTLNFAAAVADGDFDLSLRTVRTNRTNQHWSVELRQDGEIKATATAVFATARDSWADTEAHPPSTPAGGTGHTREHGPRRRLGGPLRHAVRRGPAPRRGRATQSVLDDHTVGARQGATPHRLSGAGRAL